ncbi:hypothetical protein [Aestuariirhabdus sp. LZHN29]|uniref:hypothetical protein n=1 Tax=Aestuariirhabdus sp. LZHN29 TaxID=3417462 RepID=UPI003CEF36B7
MDIRTRYLVAASADVDLIAENPHQPERWPGFACMNLDLEKLVDLLALSLGQPLNGELIQSFEVLNQASVHGPWLIRLPGALCSALVGLDDAARGALALQWSGADSFKGAPWSSDDLRTALKHLGALAQLAQERNENVLLYQGFDGEPVVVG